MDKTQLDAALELAEWGFNVLPARGKAPAVTWQRYQEQRADPMLHQWFAGNHKFNYWVLCGAISGIVVLDIDNAAADEYWHGQIGDLLERTACVRTAKGHHYYFRIPEDRETTIASWGRHDDEVSFDVRAEGTGVIAPPSVHPDTGLPYEWVRDPSQGVEYLPEALFGPQSGLDGPGGAQVRSMLAELLTNPPRGEGGRNDWLARVAGHYAKTFRNTEDAYWANCRSAHNLLDTPLSDAEFEKTVRSIWKKEAAKPEREVRAAECTYDTGWLVSGGDRLLTMAKRGDEKVLEQWADFDLVALGVARRGDTSTWQCMLRTRRGEEIVLLPGAVLGAPPKLAVWLTNYRVGINPPPGEVRNLGTRADRLRQYLEHQEPPQFDIVDCLGWHDGVGFVTHDGIITAEGLSPLDSVRPDPQLRDRARYTYGFAPADEAIDVLREVLTFHDETVCSVFGAWWVACLLRGQLSGRTSVFPFMALEAPSESGKSTGFFSLMMQLGGSSHGQLVPTKAALRDMVASHRSGIVWVDDVDDPAYLMELLRAATGNEAGLVKKAEDNTAQVEVRLVAPIVISGEALSLHGQKALADRAVQLEVPSPTNRRSIHDPDRPQWDDILELRARHPDLTVFAGTLVQAALVYSDALADFNELREGGGRFGDKVAVLRVGARVLAEITGDTAHVDRVDRWCLQQTSVGNENTLTLKILPGALRQTGWTGVVLPGEGRWPPTPVIVDEHETVWFCPAALGQWWSEMCHGRVEVRTETAEAFRQQAKALGLGGAAGVNRREIKIRGTQNRLKFWSLGRELSQVVLARSRDEATDGVIVEAVALRNELFGDFDPTIMGD